MLFWKSSNLKKQLKKSKSILIIAYYFPPMGTIAFLRNYYISKYLSALFDNSFLISVRNISIPLKDKIPVDFVEIKRVNNFDYRNFGKLLSGKKNIRNKANEKSNSFVIRFFRKMKDSFPANILFGEGGLLYIVNATLKGITLVKKHNITHIYSSFRPMADHIIAYNIKIFFPKVKWIVDFRDSPVDENLNNVYFKNLQKWFLKKLLKNADIITAVSDGVKDSISKYNSEIITLRNGIYQLYDTDKKREFEKFTIAYTGSLYMNLRKPESFFKVLQLLLSEDKIGTTSFQLIYAGKDGSIWDKWIEEYDLQAISNNMGELSLSESINIQNSCHINLLLSWSEKKQKGILTGKFYEYLSAGKPIFAMIKGEKDVEFESVFSELNAGFIFYDKDIQKIEKNILYFYNEWQKLGKINHVFNKEKLEEYSWENRISQLKDKIF